MTNIPQDIIPSTRTTKNIPQDIISSTMKVSSTTTNIPQDIVPSTMGDIALSAKNIPLDIVSNTTTKILQDIVPSTAVDSSILTNINTATNTPPDIIPSTTENISLLSKSWKIFQSKPSSSQVKPTQAFCHGNFILISTI